MSKDEKDAKKDTKEVVKKKTLKSRDFTIDFTKKLGSTQLVNQSDALNSAGFYCDVCNCKIRDSNNYLDHINGLRHQKALGVTMKVQRSSLQDVKAVLSKRKRTEYNFQDRVNAQLEAEEKEKLEKRELKKKKKEEEEEEKEVGVVKNEKEIEEFQEFGLPFSFGSSKK